MPEVTLTLKMNANGAVTAEGPIDQPVLCYGILEAAKYAIQKFNDKRNSPIVTAPASSLELLNKN